MAEAHGRDVWTRHGELVWMLAITHGDPKKMHNLRPEDFTPYGRERDNGVLLTSENIDLLKSVFPQVKGEKP